MKGQRGREENISSHLQIVRGGCIRTKAQPHGLLLSHLIVLYLKRLQLIGWSVIIHVWRGSNKNKIRAEGVVIRR